MDELIGRVVKLPKELEMKIWKDVCGYEMYKINQKIKYEANFFGIETLNDSTLYEFWFQMGLKKLPKECWKKISKHHERYKNDYKWDMFEQTGEPYYEHY